MAVRLEGVVRVMKPATVGLDDQLRIAPEKVGTKAGVAEIEQHVHLGAGQAGPTADLQEAPLELASRPADPRVDLLQRHSQASDATPPAISIDEQARCARIQDSQYFRLRDRLTELFERDDGGKIEQSLLDRRTGDTVPRGPMRSIQAVGTVRIDALRAAAATVGRGDVNRAPLTIQQPPELGRGTVREDSRWSACEHRGHPDALGCQSCVADGVHTLVNRVKAPQLDSAMNRALPDIQRQELIQRHHAVLPSGKAPNLSIDVPRGRLATVCVGDWPVGGRRGGRHGREGGGGECAGCARGVTNGRRVGGERPLWPFASAGRRPLASAALAFVARRGLCRAAGPLSRGGGCRGKKEGPRLPGAPLENHSPAGGEPRLGGVITSFRPCPACRLRASRRRHSPPAARR